MCKTRKEKKKNCTLLKKPWLLDIKENGNGGQK